MTMFLLRWCNWGEWGGLTAILPEMCKTNPRQEWEARTAASTTLNFANKYPKTNRSAGGDWTTNNNRGLLQLSGVICLTSCEEIFEPLSGNPSMSPLLAALAGTTVHMSFGPCNSLSAWLLKALALGGLLDVGDDIRHGHLLEIYPTPWQLWQMAMFWSWLCFDQAEKRVLYAWCLCHCTEHPIQVTAWRGSVLFEVS